LPEDENRAKIGVEVKMKIEKGSTVWLPCEIRPGPFSSERRVLVRTAYDEWFGFVDISDLREDKNLVRATVAAIHNDGRVTLAIRGHSPASHAVREQKSAITAESGSAVAS
jgi:hypothetical protein